MYLQHDYEAAAPVEEMLYDLRHTYQDGNKGFVKVFTCGEARRSMDHKMSVGGGGGGKV